MKTLSLDDYIAPSAGVKETTAALQKLIDDAAGGGAVASVSPGEWTIATVELRSDLHLRLEPGCVLRAHPDVSDYPARPRGHDASRQPYHLVSAVGCARLTIEGPGVIDGQGRRFWDEPIGDPEQGSPGVFWRATRPRVSPLVDLRDCAEVTLRGFTLRNSPGWTLHTFRCERVRIESVRVANDLHGPNTDGFDINGCRDVWVRGCELACGDDAIILKATPDGQSCERICVSDCIVQSNCAALGLGAETTCGIREVTFANCVVRSALRMIQIECWEPGVVENVAISNIAGRTMSDVPLERPIYIDIQHHGRTDGALACVRDVAISNFLAETRGRIVLTAADGAKIENVTLRDVHLRYPEIEDPAFTVPRMQSHQMSNDSPQARVARAAVVLDNVRGLRLENVRTAWPDPDAAAPPAPAYPGVRGTLPMHALWCRNVSETVIDAPALTPSRPGVEALVRSESTLDIRALGESPKAP